MVMLSRYGVEEDVAELFDRHLARVCPPWPQALLAKFEADLLRVSRVAGVVIDPGNLSHFLTVRLTDGALIECRYRAIPQP